MCLFKTARLKVLFSVHINKYLLWVHLLGRKFTAILASQLSLQCLLTIDSLATLLSVHRLRSRAVQRRQLSFLANIVQKFHRCLWCQTLLHVTLIHIPYKVIVIDLDHGSIGTCSKTFHLKKREHTVLGSFTVLNAKFLLNGLHDLF